MRIVASELVLKADHASISRSETSERLRMWTGQPPNLEPPAGGGQSFIADISALGRQMLSAAPMPDSSPSRSDSTDPVTAARAALENDPIIILIRRMLVLLLGEEAVVDSPAEPAPPKARQDATAPVAGEIASAPVLEEPNWGMEYDYHAVKEEHESTGFSASGTIRTADGKEISFSLDVAMERHYREETSVSLRAGNAVRKDPLVVNFGGTAAQLAAAAGRSFRFDLDADGSTEDLPLFASGSGYLTLDLNGNGRIDDGRELFGPASGNGFADLARHDDDGNGWIDAGDAVFDRLTVWTPAAEDDGKLRSLADLGIGALALAHAATPFALRGDGNADLGAIKSSGLYLREDGGAGSLQEIDLTV